MLSESFYDNLFIDYQYVRIYCNSIGMQAFCERSFGEDVADVQRCDGPRRAVEAGEQGHIQEVISGSCKILERVILLGQSKRLRFAPVRTFLRTVTASIFLLKAMSISVRDRQLRAALGTLNRCVDALRSSTLDDMHLAGSYATLLELHTNRFEKGFLASSRQFGVDLPHVTRDVQPPVSQATQRPQCGELDNFDNWLSLPFDPTMAPFGPGSNPYDSLGFESNGLEFIWNLPT